MIGEIDPFDKRFFKIKKLEDLEENALTRYFKILSSKTERRVAETASING